MTSADRAFIKAFTAPTSRGHTASRQVELAAAAPRAPRAARSLDEHQAASRVAPLSSYVAEPRIDDPLRAVIELERLAFPPGCEAIYSQAGAAWSRFVDELIENLDAGQKCLAVTSTHRGEGRTMICLAIGRQLAARGKRVVVIDADFENPALAASCGLKSYTGWGDVMRAQLPLGETLIAAVRDGITLMPWQGPAIRASELAGSLNAAAQFEMLRERFDFMLIDTTNVAGQTTAGELARFAETMRIDSCYVVQDVRWTMDEPLGGTCEKLARAGLNVQGVIENFMPVGASAAPADRIPSRARRPAALVHSNH